jgi:hypothetical protein
MVARIATVGLVILVVGLLLGVYAAYTPVSTSKVTSFSLLNTSLKVDPNDYESQNVQLNKSQTVNIQTVSINNQTIFYFYIMNQSEYYNFYGCAPFCRGAPNGSAAFTSGAGTTSVPLATFTNVTVTPSNPYSNHNFTAPTNGTYYFIFDNTEGPSYSTYANQNATGNTLGQFTLLGYGPVTTHAVNSIFLYSGVALLIIGGAIATAMWSAGRARPKGPPSMATTATPPPTSRATSA